MGKRGKTPKKKSHHEYDDPHDMDDEIDTFHKQRDIIPLDVNGDAVESSEDDELPVLDDKNIDYDDEDDDDEDDDAYDTGLAAKIKKQQKFLRSKFGGSDDEMDEEDEEITDKKRIGWGGRKDLYYGGDEQSSDDEAAKMEEEEAMRIMKERAKDLTEADFGLDDEDDRELTLEEISVKGKALAKTLPGKEAVADIGALSTDEQMDALYSSAPELMGLLSELNDAVEELEKLDSVTSKFKDGVMSEAGKRYLEVKQLLLVAYCQAITFYLLLKSEGHSVRDHPVIARLVEIKGLLDKVKELDGNLSLELEGLVKENSVGDTMLNTVTENSEPALESDFTAKALNSSTVFANRDEKAENPDSNQLEKVESLKENGRKEAKRNQIHDQIGVQSAEMLKLRAALEEKLKQKRGLNSLLSKPDKSKKNQKPVSKQLETSEDFDDEATNVKNNENKELPGLSKLSQLVASKRNISKVISGDDDMPKRDDIGERRRKHELRVLAGAGIKSEDDGGKDLGFVEADGSSDEEGDEEDDANDTDDSSEDEFYKQVKEKRAERLATKKQMYSRTVSVPSSVDQTVDGKRLISTQIDKNRGLTRKRKRENKNPRKKYRNKHDKAVKRRKGQVREIKKPTGPYGGETTGINARVSRSVRF